MKEFGYTPEEKRLFKKLNTPSKIQDYLNSLSFNFNEKWGNCMSPRRVMREGSADCIEGALFASAVMEFHGKKPLVLDLRTIKKPYDYDHVVALFKVDGCWGCISKTNHSVLRYRDPVYKNIRELVMSFFNEYFLDNGQKTLREYSVPINLNKFNKLNWRTSENDLVQVMEGLDEEKHFNILTQRQIKNLRKAEKIEIEASKKAEYRKK